MLQRTRHFLALVLPIVCLLAIGLGTEATATLAPAPMQTQPPQDRWKMPDTPDASDLNNYPTCTAKSITGLQHCISALDYYRSATVEVYRLRVTAYLRQLKEFDKKVERGHASGTLNDEDYDALHDNLSDELADASVIDGKYMVPYKGRLDELKKDTNSDQSAIDYCRKTMNCPASG